MGELESKQPSQKLKKTRFIVMILSALLLFGNNYSFDNPQALQTQIMSEVQISLTQFNFLYSFFSLPNIFLTFFGGCFIDYIGGSKSIIIFAFFVTLSQIIIAIGGTLKIFWIMLFGRVILGISSENLIIAQNVIITQWFKGNNLSVASGCIVTLPEIASALNSYFSPIIYEYTQTISYPLFISVFVCIFSLICAYILTKFDKTRNNLYQQEKNEKSQIETQDESHEHESFQDISNNSINNEKINYKDIFKLPSVFWYLISICSLSLGIYLSFMDDVNDYYQKKFNFKPAEAGLYITIPYLVSAMLCPFIGFYIDKIGHRRFFLMVTCFLFIIAQIIFGSIHVASNEKLITIIPLIIQGLAFACYSCIMIPCIQYIVSQQLMGTAFGLLGALESFTLSLFPIIAGEIVESSNSLKQGYKNMSLFYSILGLLCLFLCITLYHYESSSKLDFIDPNNPTQQELRRMNEYSMIAEEKYNSKNSMDDNLRK